MREGDGIHRFYYTGTVLSLWGTDAFLFTVHFPLYHLCLENRDIQGCLKLLIFKLFIIGHFSQGTAAKAFFQKGEISLAVTMGKLLAELRQGWRKVKAVRVNPRWDASLHLHATSQHQLSMAACSCSCCQFGLFHHPYSFLLNGAICLFFFGTII